MSVELFLRFAFILDMQDIGEIVARLLDNVQQLEQSVHSLTVQSEQTQSAADVESHTVAEPLIIAQPQSVAEPLTVAQSHTVILSQPAASFQIAAPVVSQIASPVMSQTASSVVSAAPVMSAGPMTVSPDAVEVHENIAAQPFPHPDASEIGFRMAGRRRMGYSELLTEMEEGVPKTEKVWEPIAGIIFFGFVANLPINYMMQEIVYFKSILGESFGAMCSMIYAISNLVGQVLVLLFASKFSFATRLSVSGIGIGFVLLCIPLMTLYEFSFRLGLSLSLMGLLGFLMAIFMSAAMGLSGMLSENLRNYFAVGMSLPGLSGWPIMLLLDLFFGFCGLSPVGRDGMPSAMDTATVLALMSIAGAAMFISVVYYLCGLSKTKVVMDALEADTKSTLVEESSSSDLKKIAPVLPMAIAVFGVFFVTFIVLPDQITAWKSDRKYIGGEFGYQNLNYYTFQIFDFAGRIAVALGFSLSPLGVGIGSLARFGLLPLFFLATHNVSIFEYDFTRFALTAVFAITYGALLTLGLKHGPAAVEKSKAATAGYIMSFALNAGIFVGACFAIGIQHVPAAIFKNAQYKRECRVDNKTAELVCNLIYDPTK